LYAPPLPSLPFSSLIFLLEDLLRVSNYVGPGRGYGARLIRSGELAYTKDLAQVDCKNGLTAGGAPDPTAGPVPTGPNNADVSPTNAGAGPTGTGKSGGSGSAATGASGTGGAGRMKISLLGVGVLVVLGLGVVL